MISDSPFAPAAQGAAQVELANNLTTTEVGTALDATQGKELKDAQDAQQRAIDAAAQSIQNQAADIQANAADIETNANSITAQQAEVDTKASQADHDTLAARVDTNETAIANRATITELSTLATSVSANTSAAATNADNITTNANAITALDNSLATVATTGDYNDLANTPDLSSLDNFDSHPSRDDFPTEGNADIVYCDTSSGELYRWTPDDYVVISGQLALGTSEHTAHAGNKGAANTAAIADLQPRMTAVENTATNNANNITTLQAQTGHMIYKVATLDQNSYADTQALANAYAGQIGADGAAIALTGGMMGGISGIYHLNNQGGVTVLSGLFDGLEISNNDDDTRRKWDGMEFAITSQPFSTDNQVKLGSVQHGAQVNPNAAQTKIIYEGNPDTNAFTDAEKTKLANLSEGSADINTRSDIVVYDQRSTGEFLTIEAIAESYQAGEVVVLNPSDFDENISVAISGDANWWTGSSIVTRAAYAGLIGDGNQTTSTTGRGDAAVQRANGQDLVFTISWTTPRVVRELRFWGKGDGEGRPSLLNRNGTTEYRNGTTTVTASEPCNRIVVTLTSGWKSNGWYYLCSIRVVIDNRGLSGIYEIKDDDAELLTEGGTGMVLLKRDTLSLRRW